MKKVLSGVIMFSMVVVLSIASRKNSYAEDSSTRVLTPNVYVTLGGYGLLYGVGGELLIMRHLGLNIGYSSYSDGSSALLAKMTLVPMHAAYYFGDNHRFYLEAGATYLSLKLSSHMNDIYFFDNLTESMTFFSGSFGYNYCAPDSYFYFKTGPLFFVIQNKMYVWYGLSAGVSF
jgi:hypothetical protein